MYWPSYRLAIRRRLWAKGKNDASCYPKSLMWNGSASPSTPRAPRPVRKRILDFPAALISLEHAGAVTGLDLRTLRCPDARTIHRYQDCRRSDGGVCHASGRERTFSGGDYLHGHLGRARGTLRYRSARWHSRILLLGPRLLLPQWQKGTFRV